MKTTMRKLLLLNRIVGKYLRMSLPEEPKLVRQKAATLVEEGDWFRDASHIVLNPNSFELGFVEEVFSRFLRTLS
jgi:hypothetical protein